MFERYAQIKPIVTGVCGQDIVTPETELLGDATTLKEMQTQLLVDRMTRNHAKSMIDLSQQVPRLKPANVVASSEKVQLRMDDAE